MLDKSIMVDVEMGDAVNKSVRDLRTLSEEIQQQVTTPNPYLSQHTSRACLTPPPPAEKHEGYQTLHFARETLQLGQFDPRAGDPRHLYPRWPVHPDLWAVSPGAR